MKLINRERAVSAFRSSLLPIFVTNMVAGTLASIAFFFGLFRPTPPITVVMEQPPALRTPTPPPRERVPVAPVQPRPLTHLRELPRSLGASADPRRVQYENHVSITVGGQTIALPIHTGTVDVKLGPVVLTVPAGQDLVWDPTTDVPDVESESQLIVAFSDAPAESSTEAVTIQAANQSTARALDPLVYAPENWTFPYTITNNTSRDARVTVIVWTNTVPGATPTIDL